jgi:hypothetical protein
MLYDQENRCEEKHMAKRWCWLVSGGLFWGMLFFPQLLLTQQQLRLESCPPLERLSDRELQQLSGQGSGLPHVQQEQPITAIKLWDEWSRPQQSGNLGTTGQNQVIGYGSRR